MVTTVCCNLSRFLLRDFADTRISGHHEVTVAFVVLFVTICWVNGKLENCYRMANISVHSLLFFADESESMFPRLV